ncbi:MAG: IPT/TIG domain-containing protein, partial [Acidimicrobiia bacterium]|nr:IPT/TIG domain-containing protein [Acidimicrobiia bacterium]
MVGRKGLSFLVAAGAVPAITILLFQAPAGAAPSVTVTPSSGLTNGQTVTVSGSGFSGSIGAVTECNTATGEPTVLVAGQQIPVSCSNPLTALQNLTGGAFSGKSFTVHSGTVGPPGTGTDSAGHDAAADAASYPCPPTAAQVAAGAACVIAYGTRG